MTTVLESDFELNRDTLLIKDMLSEAKKAISNELIQSILPWREKYKEFKSLIKI